MNNTICIIGVGAVTSIGFDATATAASARAGIAYFNEHPYMIDRMGDPYVLAMAPFLDAGTIGAARYIQLAIPAIKEALNPLTDFKNSDFHVETYIGIPENRPGFPSDLQDKLWTEIGKHFSDCYKISEVSFIDKGHSSGLMAMEEASRKIRSQSAEFCLAGGIDSYIDPDTLDWIEESEQLHISSNAWGFIPGEAASFCLLCSRETADKYNLPVQAELIAIATANEENKIKTETVCIGQGLTKAVKGCLKELPSEFRIDYTICDQNGEAYRADEYGFMLARLSEHFADPSDFMAPADCWGDVGAASGSLFVNLVIAAAKKGYARGSHTLLWTSSEGGERSAAIVYAGRKKKE